jgi:branched-chain amino acid transport system permease protein
VKVALRGIALAVLAIGLIAPLGVNGYYLNLLYQTVLFVALAYAWNIISGYAGYFSFGQIAFFGIGAYATGLTITTFGGNWFEGAMLGGLLCGILAVPIGFVMLRLRGPFFSLGMLGLAMTVRALVSSSPQLGGGTGMFLPPGATLLPVYYWTLGLAIAAFAITWWIDHSAFGLQLQAIREDETIAGTLGVPQTRVKVAAFVLSAMIPGFVGGGYAWFLTYIEPTSAFSSRIDLQTIVMAVLGGIGTLWGPLVGGILMTQVSEALWAQFPQAYLMIFGGLLVALLILLPRGIVPAIASRLPPARAARERGTETGMVPAPMVTHE